MTRAWAALAVAGGVMSATGCGTGTPAAPAFDAGVFDTGPSFAVCPQGLDASFTDLLTRVLATASCGTSTPFNCHSPSGSSGEGAGDLLNLALASSTVDGGLTPAQIYAELVGDGGGGVVSANISGDQKIDRVVPGDAGASMLYIKLTLTAANDPHYGAGMPLTTPGSICPAALGAVRDWINQGARQN